MNLSPIMKGGLVVFGLLLLLKLFTETPEQAMIRQMEEQNMQMMNGMNSQSQMMDQQMMQEMQQMQGYNNSYPQNGYPNQGFYRSSGEKTPEELMEKFEDGDW